MSEVTVEHWMDIVRAVFTAEHKVIDDWRDRLEEAKTADDPTRTIICDAYVRAVAEEIINKENSNINE